MKELRGKVIFAQHRAELRVLYVFDACRTAILLIGEKVRTILLDSPRREIASYTELAFLRACRAQRLRDVTELALEERSRSHTALQRKCRSGPVLSPS